MDNLEYVHLRDEDVRNARLFANRVDLVRGLGLRRGGSVAEIGVLFGDFSVVLMEALQPKTFYGFDLFEKHKVEKIWGRPSEEFFEGKSHLQYYNDRMASYRDCVDVVVRQGDSAEQLALLPDNSLDLIYIDGDHELTAVWRDTRACLEKIRPDGLLIFNDYIKFDHFAHEDYGIIPVVNQLCVNHGWEVIGFAFQEQMFCDIALRKKI